MKHYYRLLLIVLCFSTSVVGQSIPFQVGYNGGAEDLFKSVAECSDGGFIAVGATKSFGAGNNDILLVRTDWNGNVRWSRTIGTTGSDVGNGIVCTNDNGFIIVGSTDYFQSQSNTDALILRTDSNGVVLWSKSYGVDTLPDAAECILKTTDGYFIVGGSTYAMETNSVSMHALSMKIDSLGNLIWIRKTANGNADHHWFKIIELTGGNIAEVGSIDGGYMDGIIEIISPTGTSLRHKKFGTASGYEYFYSIAQGVDGKLMAVGVTSSFGAGGYDVYLVRADTALTTSLFHTAGTSGTEFGYSISATPDSGYIVTGMTNAHSPNGFYDPFLMKVNSSGVVLWTKVYGTTYADITSSSIVSQDGHYVLAGYSYGLSLGNNTAAFLMKTDVAGNTTCNTDTIAFTQTVNGFMTTYIPYDSITPDPFISRTLFSVPISGLQLNPLCLNGISSVSDESQIHIYPNPSNGNFTLLINDPNPEQLLVEIYGRDGRLLLSIENLQPGVNEINAAQLPTGLYFIEISSRSENLLRTKLIITH